MSGVTRRQRAIVRLTLFAVIVLGTSVIVQRIGARMLTDPVGLAEQIRRLPFAFASFVLVYAVATSLALPATPFSLAGGVIFGVAGGSVANWVGATLGATGSFLLARWLGAEGVRALLGRHARRVDWLSSHASATAIVRLRLIPVVPFDGISVAAGLAGMSLRSFVIGTATGIIPGTVLYAWLGRSLMVGVTTVSGKAFWQLAVGGTLLVLLSFLPQILRRARTRPESSR